MKYEDKTAWNTPNGLGKFPEILEISRIFSHISSTMEIVNEGIVLLKTELVQNRHWIRRMHACNNADIVLDGLNLHQTNAFLSTQ